MNKNEMFDRLVENGLDFLAKAISELENSPKYSVIHFYAAVELLLKARLMSEHWSLVVTKRQEPDWKKFITGDFQSASLDETASKLDKVINSPLSNVELETFRDVARHRNKMVHFFHESQSTEEGNELTQNIVKQQLKAWHFLHQLLITKWSDVFVNWNQQISDIDATLRKLHAFLQIIFENLEDEIENLKNTGRLFEECPSCGFESQQHFDEENVIYEAKCLVCGLAEKCLRIECTNCENIVTFKNEGFAKCESCEKSLEPEDVANALIDSASAHIAAKDGDDTWGVGNCSDCDSYHTVVRTEKDDWICSCCFGEFESMEYCEWCNEPNTGDMEHSYATGCNVCEGMAGWHRDDD